MSKAFCLGAAGLVLGLTLHGCGGNTDSTTAGPSGSPDSGETTTQPGPTQAPQPLTQVPNSALRFVGRWYDDSGMKTSWGQSVVTKFSGSTRVSVTIHSDNTNFFSYRVDNGNWTKVEGKDGDILLAEGLDPTAEHTVHFGKSIESSSGMLDFDHLELDDGFTAAPPDRKLVYHAIGDSITAGFMAECESNLVTGEICDELSHSTENVYNTYVRHLAEAWGTEEWSVVARTGIGVRDIMVPPDNPTILADHKMLDQYKCREWWSSSQCQHPWDFDSDDPKPDVITVNLGTNDYVYSTDAGPPDDEFKNTYVELLQFLRETYPDATIFVISPLQLTVAGPMPDSPPNKWSQCHDNVKAVVDTIADDKVIFVPTGDRSDPPLDLTTEFVDATHPTAVGHAKFAKLLEEAMTPVIRQNHPGMLPDSQAQPVIV